MNSEYYRYLSLSPELQNSMSVIRLRLALNSTDVSIASQGLADFTLQILAEHNSKESFGYNGRCYFHTEESVGIKGKVNEVKILVDPYSNLAIDTCGGPELIKGELAALIQSSPLLEEFFQLWDIPARNEDKTLCMHHMRCLAAILHCSKQNTAFCLSIVNRILHDYVKSIHQQLSCGHSGLIHATIGLLISMARSSPQSARDLYQKLNFNHDSVMNLTMRGKKVSWTPDNNSSEDQILKLTTDSRYLFILLILVIMKHSTDDIISELLIRDSTLRKLISSLPKDSVDGIELFLLGLQVVQRDDYYLASPVKYTLVDEYFQSRVLSLLDSSEARLIEAAQSFLSDFIKHLIKQTTHVKRGVPNRGRFVALRLVKVLNGHQSLIRRDLQLNILKAQPSLLPQAIESIPWSELQASVTSSSSTLEYVSGIQHAAYLLKVVDLDPHARSRVRSLLNDSSEKDELQLKEDEMKKLASHLVDDLVPTVFSKKDFARFISTTETDLLFLQAILDFLSAFIERLHRITAIETTSSGLKSKFEYYLKITYTKKFPELTMFINLRGKLLKAISQAACVSSTYKQENKDIIKVNIEMEGDIELNIDGVSPNENLNMDTDEISDTDSESKILSKILESLSTYLQYYIMTIQANSSEMNFDFQKLLEDDLSSTTNEYPSQHLASTLKFLLIATRQGLCKWLGSKDDAVKLLTNLIVLSDWKNQPLFKRNALYKLLITCSLREKESIETRSLAVSILREILDQSGLFNGNRLVDVEMNIEKEFWLKCATGNSLDINDQLVFLSVLILSHHWNLELCFLPRTNPDISYLSFPSSVSASSPMLSCIKLLIEMKFKVFENDLPNQIKSRVLHTDHVTILSDQFFSKFISGFRASANSVLLSMISKTIYLTRSPTEYFISLLDNVSENNIDVVKENPRAYFSQDSTSQPHNAGIDSFWNACQDLLKMSSINHDQLSRVKLEFKKYGPNLLAYFVVLLNQDSNNSLNRSILLELIKIACTEFFNCIDNDENPKLFDEDQQFGLSAVSIMIVRVLSMSFESPSKHQMNDSSDENQIQPAKKKPRKSKAGSTHIHSLDEVSLNLHSTFDLVSSWIVSSLSKSNDKESSIQRLIFMCDYFNSADLPDILKFCSKGLNMINILSPLYDQCLFYKKDVLLCHPLWDQVLKSISEYSFEDIAINPVLNSLSWRILRNSNISNDKLRTLLTSIILNPVAQDNKKSKRNIDQSVHIFVDTTNSNIHSNSRSLLYSLNEAQREIVLSADLLAIKSLINPEFQNSANTMESFSDDVSIAITDGRKEIQISSANDNSISKKRSGVNILTAPLTLVKSDSNNLCLKIENYLNFSFIFRTNLQVQNKLCSLDVLIKQYIERLPVDVLKKKSFEEYLSSIATLYTKLSENIYENIQNQAHENLTSMLQTNKSPCTLSFIEDMGVILYLCSEKINHLEESALSQELLRSFVRAGIDLIYIIFEYIGAELDHASSAFDDIRIRKCFQSLKSILRLELCGMLTYQTAIDELTKYINKKKYNKFIKSCLKMGLDNTIVLGEVIEILRDYVSYSGDGRKLFISFGNLFDSNNGDYFHPVSIYRMAISHSKFSLTLVPKGSKYPVCWLLRVILQLIHLVAHSSASKSSVNSVLSEDEFLISALRGYYRGTMGESDRLILRILYLLMKKTDNGELYTLYPLGINIDNKTDIVFNDDGSWIFSALSLPQVYSTLSNFPMWRDVNPQPISPLEILSIVNEINDGNSLWKQSDNLVDTNEKVYDPCYWIPTILYYLINNELSIRQLSSCGGISLIMGSCSSACHPLLQTYSLAAMQLIYEYTQLQTPEKDAAFKDRPHINLILRFFRNSISPSLVQDGNEKKPVLANESLPPSTTLFLARSVLHIQQPWHDLYTRVGKYLVSKPYCDVKDLPLFELGVFPSEVTLTNQTHNSSSQGITEILSSLRLIRDNLHSRQDHANMCRKNAYSRLLLLFPLAGSVTMSLDQKSSTSLGHAIIDVIEKAMMQKQSSRYLIDKCGLLVWLQEASSLGGCSSEEISCKFTASFTAPSLLPRIFALLRQLICSCYLVILEGEQLSISMSQIMDVLMCISRDIAYHARAGNARAIPNDVYRQYTLCLSNWHSCILSLRNAGVDVENKITLDMCVELLKAAQLGYRPTNNNDKIELCLTIIKLISLCSTITSLSFSDKEIAINSIISSSLNALIQMPPLPSNTIYTVDTLCGLQPPLGYLDTATTKDYNLKNISKSIYMSPDILLSSISEGSFPQAWDALKSFDWDKSALPCSIDSAPLEIISICSKSLELLLDDHDSNKNFCESLNIGVCRWSLLMNDLAQSQPNPPREILSSIARISINSMRMHMKKSASNVIPQNHVDTFVNILSLDPSVDQNNHTIIFVSALMTILDRSCLCANNIIPKFELEQLVSCAERVNESCLSEKSLKINNHEINSANESLRWFKESIIEKDESIHVLRNLAQSKTNHYSSARSRILSMMAQSQTGATAHISVPGVYSFDGHVGEEDNISENNCQTENSESSELEMDE